MTRPKLLKGDVRQVLRGLEPESVQCVVTSPPYWGLRDYGVDGQLGLEQTPEEFVDNMVKVFREVKRVLRKDGTVWMNLGDTYGKQVGKGFNTHEEDGSGNRVTDMQEKHGDIKVKTGLPDKNLVGIPWRVALALQADGWILRSDIIWHKPNPMPESVKDRPTKSHEYIFLLTKSKKYYYDADAIRVPLSEVSKQFLDVANGNPLREVDGFSKEKRYSTGGKLSRAEMGNFVNPKGANKRSVWKITTKPYKEAHFATFPEELPETCIKAGTSKAGCCAECGEPYKRIVETGDKYTNEVYVGQATKDYKSAKVQNPSDVKRRVLESMRKKTTVGWKVDCDCNAERVPCVVLDPFIGSGTTCAVASRLGRDSIGIDLNEEYLKLARKRLRLDSESIFKYV